MPVLRDDIQHGFGLWPDRPLVGEMHMTRHQRRKRALARKSAKVVARNLATPSVRENSVGLVSWAYRGDAFDRARGMGVTPGHLVQSRKATAILGSAHAASLFSTQFDAVGSWNDNSKRPPLRKR